MLDLVEPALAVGRRRGGLYDLEGQQVRDLGGDRRGKAKFGMGNG